MQTEYLNRLGGMVRSLVEEIEAQVDAGEDLEPASEHRCMRCEMDEYKAEIATASTDYFPDSSVFHELQHIRRSVNDFDTCETRN